MADNIVSYRINIQDNGTATMSKLEDAANRTTGAVSGLGDKLSKLGLAGMGINFITSCFGRLYNAMQACEGAYNAQHTVETKLETAMRNTMGATMDDVQAIKDLTAAQQKLGVVGDEVQLAGAQELATFVGKKETMQSLIPVMNDMIAQQQGLNATQEGAASVAAVLGKAMNGQTGILQRYGFTVTDAQEKILKFGTESQRAATLAEIVESRVGGMNEALAQTPEGKMQQYSNAMGDVGERLGALYVRIRQACLPAMNALVDVLNTLLDMVESTISFVEDNLDVITAAAAAIGAVTVAANALAIKAAVVTAATKLWTTAQMILNAIMTANPIGLVIAAIAALVAAILWVRKHTEGWGTLWDAVCTFAKESFLAFVDGVKLYFNTLINGIMIGLDKIRLGWYKFKKACGIGDSEENEAAIRSISRQVEERQKAITEGAKRVMEHAANARKAFDNVSIRWKPGEDSKGDTNDQIKAGASLTGGTFPGLTGGAKVKGSTEAIASGGTRNTQITINFSKEMVRMEFSGGYQDNREGVERTLEESLLRVLSAAKASI